MVVFGIESSCDESSVAVVENGEITAHLVSSQRIHVEYGGVVPELATREHLAWLPRLAKRALDISQKKVSQLQAIAVTGGPGLPGALMIGTSFAQAMAWALSVPFIAINHHEAHLYSAFIQGVPARIFWDRFRPCISLIVSGGHTILVHVPAPLMHNVMGATLDDAAGECLDKTAKMLGLQYPGGPVIEKLAQKGDPNKIQFPRPMIDDPSFNFSFSGLKTSVRYYLRDNAADNLEQQTVCDICASVQAAIVDVLVQKTLRAAFEKKVDLITISGGVSANQYLRNRFSTECKKNGIELMIASREFCTDNAAMVAVVAERKLLQGNAQIKSLNFEPNPNWEL